MKRHVLKALSAIGLTLAAAPAAYALECDANNPSLKCLACEAVLCLSSSTRPGECTRSVKHYFNIDPKKLADRIKERRNFLAMCPWDKAATILPDFIDTKTKMDSLFDVIARGAGNCNANTLNTFNKKTIQVLVVEEYREDGKWIRDRVRKDKQVISSQLPNYCTNYKDHVFTDLVTAKYIGEEAKGGKWVEPGDYDRALQEYNDNLQPVNQCPNWQNLPVFDFQCQR